eukprot:2412431-Amphidinium_carterae.1
MIGLWKRKNESRREQAKMIADMKGVPLVFGEFGDMPYYKKVINNHNRDERLSGLMPTVLTHHQGHPGYRPGAGDLQSGSTSGLVPTEGGYFTKDIPATGRGLDGCGSLTLDISAVRRVRW